MTQRDRELYLMRVGASRLEPDNETFCKDCYYCVEDDNGNYTLYSCAKYKCNIDYDDAHNICKFMESAEKKKKKRKVIALCKDCIYCRLKFEGAFSYYECSLRGQELDFDEVYRHKACCITEECE